jgi:hypothetical protein
MMIINVRQVQEGGVSFLISLCTRKSVDGSKGVYDV